MPPPHKMASSWSVGGMMSAMVEVTKENDKHYKPGHFFFLALDSQLVNMDWHIIMSFIADDIILAVMFSYLLHSLLFTQSYNSHF